MGVQARSGMWCDECGRSIAAQKTFHRARGSAVAAGLFVTDLALLGATSEEWHCPDCGNEARQPSRLLPAGQAELRLTSPGWPVSARTVLRPMAKWLPGVSVSRVVRLLNAGAVATIRTSDERADKAADELSLHTFQCEVLYAADVAEEGAAASAGDAASLPALIRDLGRLRDEGLLTDEQFESKKAELLNRM